MSAHACNAREILRAQKKGNDKIYVARLLQRNGGIFKIPIVLFISICEPGDELKPKQKKVAVFREVSVEAPPSRISLNKKLLW